VETKTHNQGSKDQTGIRRKKSGYRHTKPHRKDGNTGKPVLADNYYDKDSQQG